MIFWVVLVEMVFVEAGGGVDQHHQCEMSFRFLRKNEHAGCFLMTEVSRAKDIQ